jgi:hypothetical protein
MQLESTQHVENISHSRGLGFEAIAVEIGTCIPATIVDSSFSLIALVVETLLIRARLPV